MEKKKVKIKYACPIKWDEMKSIDAKSKFCDSCKMKVHDFTRDGDLNTDGVHCGRFRGDQVESINRTFSFNPTLLFLTLILSLLGITKSLYAQSDLINIPSKSIESVLTQNFTFIGLIKHSETSQPLVDVKITVENSFDSLFSITSDSLGTFSITLLNHSILDGNLKLCFSKDGFKSTSINAHGLLNDTPIIEVSLVPNSEYVPEIIFINIGLKGQKDTIQHPFLNRTFYTEDFKTNYRQ